MDEQEKLRDRIDTLELKVPVLREQVVETQTQIRKMGKILADVEKEMIILPEDMEQLEKKVYDIARGVENLTKVVMKIKDSLNEPSDDN